ncbi:MAG: hypothetical protein R2800_08515 [Flavipsychrobacter sp.]
MLSRVAYIISLCVILFVSLVFHPTWNKRGHSSTISWDVLGYYWYLPSSFIYNDLKEQKFADSVLTEYGYPKEHIPSYKYKETASRVNKYSSGMAVLYSPFFFIAHILSSPLGYPSDGFSIPYQLSILLGSLLVAFIGLWYYRKFLLTFFSDRVVAIMILLLVIGSNYLTYTALNGAYTHNWLFTIYVFLLITTQKFYAKPKLKYAVAIGGLIGIAILVRPTEFIAVLIPLLWGIEKLSAKYYKSRLDFLLANKKAILMVAIVAVVVASVQVCYWLYTTGVPFVYSYQDQGFSWLSPHVYNYMLSARSGWVTYTPLVFFFFIGIISFVKHGKHRVMVLLFFACSLYITSAWDIWWYAGTGGRAMLQYYPIIMLPLAFFIERMLQSRVMMWVCSPFLLLFTYLNIWFTYAAHASDGLYDSNGMTRAYYWHVVGRFSVPDHVQRFKDTDEYYDGKPKNMKLLFANDFEQDSTESNSHIIHGNVSMYIDKDREWGQKFLIPFSNNTHADWVRAEVSIKPLYEEWEAWRMILYIVTFRKDGAAVKIRNIRLNKYSAPHTVSDVYFDVKIPDAEFDSIELSFHNPYKYGEMILDDIKLSSFEE